jgi:hypothetical protein
VSGADHRPILHAYKISHHISASIESYVYIVKHTARDRFVLKSPCAESRESAQGWGAPEPVQNNRGSLTAQSYTQLDGLDNHQRLRRLAVSSVQQGIEPDFLGPDYPKAKKELPTFHEA